MNIFIVLCSIVWLSVGTVSGLDSGPPDEIETSEDHLIAAVDAKESKKNNDQEEKQKKSDKPRKSERPEKTENPDKVEKSEKTEKSEKSTKEKSEKKERPNKKEETENKMDDEESKVQIQLNDDSKIIPISEVQMLKNGVKRKCKSGEWLRKD